jgi:TolB protein
MSSSIEVTNLALRGARRARLLRLGAVPLALAVLFTGTVTRAADDVVITSEQQGSEMIALGQVEFMCVRGNPKAAGYNPGDVIGADLDFSGRFRVKRAPVLTPVAKALFKQEGALAYVRGEYSFEGERYGLTAELVDLSTGEIILRKKYAGPKDQLRKAAHQFSDEMTFQLLGEKGIAQTGLAYVNRRGGAKEIWAMDYDGFRPRAITRNGSINMNPAFFGAKDKVLFSSYIKGLPQFYLTDLDAPASAPLFPSRGMNSAPAYNRTDRELAYASTAEGNSEIYRRGAAGGKADRLTFSGGIDTSPSWSPNGYEIVFMSDRSGQPQLYIMDRDGSNTRRLTYDFAYCGSPAWSPKGDRIAFSAIDDGNNLNIYTIAPDGSGAVRLTSGGSNESPAWSPDGRFIAFSSTRLGAAEIFVMRAEGGEARRLTYSGNNTMPAWSDF